MRNIAAFLPILVPIAVVIAAAIALALAGGVSLELPGLFR